MAPLKRLMRLFSAQRPPVFFHPHYRWPIGTNVRNLEPRRAELAVSYLVESRAIREGDVKAAPLVTFDELALVHTREYLEQLTHAEGLAPIFALDPAEVPVDELLRTARLACGGTVAATRLALRERRPVLNAGGGFHHAAKGRGAGFCAVNDVAVALAVARREGFEGTAVVIDLDAHPPDGTADCLANDAKSWIGSLTAKSWGPLASAEASLRVQEIELPARCTDAMYLSALDALLAQMPKPELAFVLAGGDVLAGDALGMMGMTLDGARERDRRVASMLTAIPSVWLPAGGYHDDAWKVLAGTALVLSGRPRARIPADADPLRSRFAMTAAQLDDHQLGAPSSDELLSEDDIAEALHMGAGKSRRLLGHYTKQGIEYALVEYGLWKHVERMGYSHLTVELDEVGAGERVRGFGSAEGKRHLLLEIVLGRKRIGESEVLFVNWLTLRDPRAQFSPSRPQLPGQDVPGLGLSREVTYLLEFMARRLGLDGVAFRPAWFHTAYVARELARFADPKRQGRFEALLRDLGAKSLRDLTSAIAEGRVQMDGVRYEWEASDMVAWLRPPASNEAEVAREREARRFTLIASS